MPNIHTCTECGYRDGTALRGERRALVAVIDDNGSTSLCDLCLIGQMPRLRASGHLTVFVTSPSQLAT